MAKKQKSEIEEPNPTESQIYLPRSQRFKSSIYLPPDLHKRLMLFQLEKYGGIPHYRNYVICEAIDKYLKVNGF